MNETKNALQSTHMQLLQNQMQDKNQFYWNLANPSDWSKYITEHNTSLTAISGQNDIFTSITDSHNKTFYEHNLSKYSAGAAA